MTILNRPLRRITSTELDGTYGSDRNKRIVITLIPGRDGIPDLLELRPERTRRPERITVADAYRFALRCRINNELLTKARDRKVKIAARREAASIKRAEKRIRRPTQ